jgi:predicted ATP-dependent serine protease
MAKKSGTKKLVCRECGKESQYLGACSGTCPACQNRGVAELEVSMGMKRGELGRVNKRGE